jgi:hypothetical protein
MEWKSGMAEPLFGLMPSVRAVEKIYLGVIERAGFRVQSGEKRNMRWRRSGFSMAEVK